MVPIEESIQLASKAHQGATDKAGETWMKFIERAAQDPIGLRVKLADIRDNMSPVRLYNLKHSTRNRLYEKYTKALEYLHRIDLVKVGE